LFKDGLFHALDIKPNSSFKQLQQRASGQTTTTTPTTTTTTTRLATTTTTTTNSENNKEEEDVASDDNENDDSIVTSNNIPSTIRTKIRTVEGKHGKLCCRIYYLNSELFPDFAVAENKQEGITVSVWVDKKPVCMVSSYFRDQTVVVIRKLKNGQFIRIRKGVIQVCYLTNIECL